MQRRSELLSVMNKTINKYMSLYRTVEKDERTFHVKQRQRIQKFMRIKQKRKNNEIN